MVFVRASTLLLSGARYREGRLIAIQQGQRNGEFEAAISFSPILPPPLASKPRGILHWIRSRVSQQRAAVELPQEDDIVGPLPLRLDIPTTERKKMQRDVSKELHGAAGFLLCLVTGQKPLLVHAPQIAQLPGGPNLSPQQAGQCCITMGISLFK